MQKIFCSMGLFVLVSAVIPSVLWADPPLVEPSRNSLIVESSANTRISESSLALPEVVVTANRLDTPVSQVANSMTVITAKDIEQRQARTALEALNGVPGLTLLQNGSPGENTGIFMRGADAGHTLVLLDGTPLCNPMSTSREFDALDQLFSDDIAQIEVVRGPLSTMYGTNATAGVINIVTQKGGEAPKGSFLFEGGAYQSFREAANASVGNDLANVVVSGSRFDTQGFPSADKSFGNGIYNSDGNTTASLRLGLTPSSEVGDNFSLRYFDSRTNLPAQGGAGGDDPHYFVNERQWVAGDHLNLKLFNGKWEQSLGLSFIDDLQLFSDDFSVYPNSHYERGAFEGQMGQIIWQNNLKLLRGETLVAGVQGQQEWGRQDDTTDYGYGLSNTFINKTLTTSSLFLESQTTAMERLYVTMGGRLDSYSLFGDQLTYRAAAAYFIPVAETKLKATWGKGFKAPSIYQLYSPYGDSQLLVEQSEGWDAGFEQPIGGNMARVGATYFHTEFLNLIDFDDTTFLYDNISKARTEGWETFASATLLKGLELRADYTYTWAVNLDTGNQLIRRPQDRVDFNTSYQWNGASLGLNVVYVGERPDLSFVNFTSVPVTMPSYMLVNLMASCQLDEHLKFFGRVNNLFNTVYEEVYGYGTPGLSVYAGTKVSL